MRLYQTVIAVTLITGFALLVVLPAHAAKAYRMPGVGVNETVTTVTGQLAKRCHYTYHGTEFTTVVLLSQTCPPWIEVN